MNSVQTMKTLGEILKLSCNWVRQKGSSHTRHEVEELIAYTLNKKRLDLYMNFDKPLDNEELARIRKNLSRLAANEPLQYIEGKVQFYGCSINVDPRVLIPRPETELLVDHIVKKLMPEPLEGKVLWDICTGSGCIGIAIKKALGALNVALSDISEEALAVAASNATLNEVSVDFAKGDLLEGFKGQKADFVVCNPPYVTEEEFKALAAHVKDFEPKLAFVSGKTGLECYERLIKEIAGYCNPGATVWLEIGSTQGLVLVSKLSSFKDVCIIQDLSKNDRFIEFVVA